jgi:hypothetical protein
VIKKLHIQNLPGLHKLFRHLDIFNIYMENIDTS